ncbi:GTP-binding protein 2 [Aspergillus udagawae]|nr:GTP-binding protein 2 [Aspergillus udagawae]
MASIFTYVPDPPRVSSPWSTSGSSTPQLTASGNRGLAIRTRSGTELDRADPDFLSDYGITKLEPEPQEGPTEYKLHLLLRSRRLYNSMTTGHVVGGSYHSRASLSASGPTPSSYESNLRSAQVRSTQSRQQRLQQLTTQLLWRLQQSSPFHSSTTANLVLPVLPEATPQLGTPQKPARLIPGLEESQGALYEIGVADDGTFVGLTQDELDESLTNLQVMAASLGCRVEILRRVIVGKCEWAEWPEDTSAEAAHTGKVHTESLWVAEALVSPDLEYYGLISHRDGFDGQTTSCDTQTSSIREGNHSTTEQIRISITGPTAAGKSSLLGTLTSSILDNGRGASRLSLLKHRHEISSGITSSVAQELVGYANGKSTNDPVEVINYASGNVAGWDNIHATAKDSRLAFVSDLPGSVRYLKSTLRGLISWAPHYVLLCIPANCDEEMVPEPVGGAAEQMAEINLALSHLDLCIKLGIPTVVVITKLDVASRAGLRGNLTKVLSALKLAGKKPAMLPVQSATGEQDVDLQHICRTDADEVRKVIDAANNDWSSTVPIVLTSAVSGTGVGKLHAFLRYLPIPQRPSLRSTVLGETLSDMHIPANLFDIDEVFTIPPSKVYSTSMEQNARENQGVVLCGLVRYGSISVGDELLVGPLLANPQAEPENLLSAPRSQSGRSRPPSEEFSMSFSQAFLSGKATFLAQAIWQRVRVVSVRNLRLPVRTLIQDQVGTIGIELLPTQNEQTLRLGKVRKGAILADIAPSGSPAKPSLFHTGFVASFPTSEFTSSVSPPLLLGGNAIAYVSNIRVTVKVTCVTLAEDEIISSPPSPTEPDFFGFDSDVVDRGKGHASEVNNVVNSAKNTNQGDVKISFSFVTSVEWVEAGSRVLVVPGTSTPLSPAQGSAPPLGLGGFVGRVCNVVSSEP